MEIQAGTLVCISGPSGIGKSTLIDVLLGLSEPTKGDIYVDGVRRAELDKVKWHEMIGYVPQDVTILNDTLFRNIALDDASIKTSDVISALAAAGATSVLEEKSGGIHQILGERGGQISGGQRQPYLLLGRGRNLKFWSLTKQPLR